MQKYRSGETVPATGEYKALDRNGESRDEETTYLEKGETFPPTQHSGAYWVQEKENTK